NHPEGYIEPDGNNYKYIYQYKDHLGNIRLSYADNDNDGKIDVLRNNVDIDGDGDNSMEILEEKNYYPFGLQHKGYNNTITGREHLYGYNGKEEEKELGLNWHDFGFRNYDASLGRWMNIDNLAEQYQSLSPYNYTMNNPVFFVDPDGQEVVIHFDKTKNRLYIYDDDKWDDNLDTRAVSAEEYKFSFGEDEEKYNQILVIHNVFSGGNDRDGDGEIEYGADENQKEIPNGEYDLTDNKLGVNPNHYRIDSKTDGNRYNDRYDDPSERNSKGELRDGFRLHLGALSWGCVTICQGPEYNKKQKEWNVLDKIIKSTSNRTVNDRKGKHLLNPFSRLTVYGTITVSGQNPKPKRKKGN
ncbi:RHS repeat-associated core domain-containing protein, partial [Aquimarina sp. 2201CG5-10]|uniref:RHS repeat-associated core domain-containing protein n=1 Tax=Aquimarina callyspongiae TaxID=3098150 RepID=UPI002AB4CB81